MYTVCNNLYVINGGVCVWGGGGLTCVAGSYCSDRLTR